MISLIIANFILFALMAYGLYTVFNWFQCL